MASAYLVPTASRNSPSNLSISSYALSMLSTTRLTYSFSSAPTLGHESPAGAVTAFGPPSMASVGSAIGYLSLASASCRAPVHLSTNGSAASKWNSWAPGNSSYSNAPGSAPLSEYTRWSIEFVSLARSSGM